VPEKKFCTPKPQPLQPDEHGRDTYSIAGRHHLQDVQRYRFVFGTTPYVQSGHQDFLGPAVTQTLLFLIDRVRREFNLRYSLIKESVAYLVCHREIDAALGQITSKDHAKSSSEVLAQRHQRPVRLYIIVNYNILYVSRG
jgi:hypothetical protein